MAIKTEDLKKALGGFSQIEKRETNKIDLLKISETLVNESAAAIESDDPDKAVDALLDRIGKIEDMLDDAVETDEGDVAVTRKADDPLVKEFVAKADVDMVAAGGGGGKPDFPAGVASGTGSQTDTTGAGGGGGKPKFPKGVQTGTGSGTDETGAGGGGGKSKPPASVANSGVQDVGDPKTIMGKKDGEDGEETDVEKADEDDGAWPSDMAPGYSPVNKNERYTKDERPILARKGASQVKKSYKEKRDRALQRAADGKNKRNLA